MRIYTCPICGKDLMEVCYPTYPPQYGVECFNCGFKEDTYRDTIERIPFQSKKTNILHYVLSEHFNIPCDLCNEYFEKDGSCPKEIEQCNNEEHWRLLIERIKKNEKD